MHNPNEVNIEKFKVVISAIKKKEFTTHDFIKKYGSKEFFEKDYVQLLWERREGDEADESIGIFQRTHSKFGKFLLNHQKELGIQKLEGKFSSTDMFGTRQQVAKYKKL
jgi:hypothetical protein